MEIRSRSSQHRIPRTVAGAVAAVLLAAAGLGVLAAPAGAAGAPTSVGGTVPSPVDEHAGRPCEELPDEVIATEGTGDTRSEIDLDAEAVVLECDDEDDDRGADLDAICPENPDLEGCTQLGQPVTIVNEDQPIELVVEDRAIEADAVATASMTIDRPATEVGGQVTHRDGVAVTAEVQAPVVATHAPQLPRTGTEHAAAVAAGLALILLGAGLLHLGGRTRTRPVV